MQRLLSNYTGTLQMIRDRYHKLIKPQPLVAYLSIYTGFLFAMMFSFFASFNYVFQLVYHFNQKEIDLTFIGIIIDYIFARLFLANNWLILVSMGTETGRALDRTGAG